MLRSVIKPMLRSDYKRPAFLIPKIDLDFDLISPQKANVQSKMYLKRNETKADLVLDGVALKLKKLSVDDVKLEQSQVTITDETLSIPWQLLPQTDEFTVRVEVELEPEQNLSYAGLYMDGGGSFITQCEAHGFRRITYSMDRPDVLSIYNVSVTANKRDYPVLLSNGNLTESKNVGNGRHLTKWHDPFPKPSYLFALVAGDLGYVHDTYTTKISNKVVDLYIYTEHKNVDQVDFAMYSLKRSMEWDEEKYGREYDLNIFNIVATDSFNMGAMENKSLNVFNTSVCLGRHDMSTDEQLTNILRVIGHEYFHNWTGNRVTCRDWFQLTLKEGFTVFRDQQFTCDETSEASKRIDDISRLRSMQWPEDASPMAHPIRPEQVMVQDNFYTPTVYDKGAEVIRLYHTLLGPELFRLATDLYFERHDGDAVTCDDFRKAMSDTVLTHGHNKYLANIIDGQFERWYSQDGTPVLNVESMEHDGTTLIIKFHQFCPPSQLQPKKLPFVIPIKFGVLNPNNGEDLPIIVSNDTAAVKLLHGDTFVMTEGKETLILNNIPQGAVVSFLRGLSAPVKLKIPESIQTTNHLAFQMANDQDWFNRYDASQKFAKKIIINKINNKDTKSDTEKFLQCFRTMLNDDIIDPALKASALSLPGFENINEAFETDSNPDAICQIRKALKIRIANALKDDFVNIYDSAREACGAGYEFNPQHVAHRRLANLCLMYMTSCDPLDSSMVKICENQFYNSNNMTDQYGALSCMAQMDNAASNEAIRKFYEQWNENSLVLDRWFAVQSMSSLPHGVERVKQLMKHEKFSISNPNKLRSVVSSFCRGNPEQFHNADGSGYKFLGDVIRDIDPVNPQMGAGLTKIFLDWTKYDAHRRNFIKAELEQILHNDGASSNTIEVATTALKAERLGAKM